jgi:hypothetical protein
VGEEIRKAIRRSDAVLICLSRTAVTREGISARRIEVCPGCGGRKNRRHDFSDTDTFGRL